MPRGDLNNTFKNEKNKQTNKPIYLFEINYSGSNWVYYTDYSQNVVYDGTTYTKFPIKLDFIGENLKGEIEQIVVTAANPNRIFETYLEDYDGLKGSQINIKYVWANQLDDADAYIQDTFYVEQANATEEAVSLTLTTKFDLNRIQLPRRRFHRNYCQWKFKSTQCGYSGAETECNKTFQRCKALNNESRYGGFPAIPRSRIIIR